MNDPPAALPVAESDFQRQLKEMNEALLVSSVRQHELIEQARKGEAALRQAHAELEARVLERTADLARANDALHAEVRERDRADKAMNALLRRRATVQEDERRRIACELHDQTAQLAFALVMGLQLLDEDLPEGPFRDSSRKAHAMAGELMQQVRHLAFDLHPAKLDERGLADALGHYLAVWSERSGIVADLNSTGEPARSLPREAATALYRVAQEMLSNVAKHAGATRVRLGVDVRPDEVVLTVADDGKGFDSRIAFETPLGERLGLWGMRDRLGAVGGRLEVDSAPGKGTTMTACVPMPPALLPSPAKPESENPKNDSPSALLKAESDFQRQLKEMNEALMVSSVRQHELTEQAEKAEAVTRKSEARFRALFQLGPTAVYSCDEAGVIQEFNRRAAELWGREPVLGDTDEQFCGSFKMFRPDGSFMPHDQCPMAEVVAGRIAEVHDAEVLIERLDGSRVSVVVNIRPLLNERGEVTGAINCFYDISERKQAENQMKEQAAELGDLHRRKDEFLAMLSHELRNPLAPISNAVQLLGVQRDENPVQHQARTIIERQVKQLKHLVNDLLEVARFTTGRIRLHRERVAASSFITNAAEAVGTLIGQRRHVLQLSVPPEPIWLNADAARLEQVVVNLLTNAAKYTNEGGHIWLDVMQEDNECVLTVRDTGIGIAPELLPHIFDLFTQAERSIDRSQGGLGIGLSLVKRLVELHGGKVEVSSVVGQGSEFVVRLPVAELADPQSPPVKDIGAPIARSLRVLVVDDNVDTAESLAMLLRAKGHDVRTAHDGPTAAEAAVDYRPDVVLLDIGLPRLSGYEVAKRIRQQPLLQNAVLVAITGYGQDTHRQHAREAGFAHHLVKPLDFGKLQAILAGVSDQVK